MTRWLQPARLGPIVAGLAGIGWISFMAGIPATFLWLVLFGVSSADTLASRTTRSARLPEASEAIAT
jgi:hypothetical protein